MCITRAEQRGKIISLELPAILYLMQPRRLLTFFTMSAAWTTWCPPGPPNTSLHNGRFFREALSHADFTGF